MQVKYIIRYSEIGLKGKLVFKFEQFLKLNILQTLKTLGINATIRFNQKQGILSFTYSNNKLQFVENALASIPGIAWFGRVYSFLISSDIKLPELTSRICTFLQETFESNVKIEVKRYYKGFSFTSQDIFLHAIQNCPTLDRDAHIIAKIFIYKDNVEIIEYKHGIGGLPVGSSGKGIVLLSGGIDSPVATYLASKRGLALDLLHFYPENATDKELEKIKMLWSVLQKFNPRMKLYLASVKDLKHAMQNTKYLNYKMVLFKRFMVRSAVTLGLKKFKRDFAIILGDSLGQVASQTLSNLAGVNQVACEYNVPIIRPLIAYNKQEITELARRIGTYEISNLPYQDFCSGLLGGTKTRSNIEKLLEFETNYDISSIIDKTINNIEVIKPNVNS